MDAYLGLDLGTTGLKALLVDPEGRPLHAASHPLSLSAPEPAWAEQDPAQWIRAAETLLATLPKKHRVRRIGISGQMHSLVPLDEKGQVIRPAILWCDQRSSAQCLRAAEALGGEKRVIELVGNPIYAGFTLSKLLWLREEEPENYRRLASFLLPKDFLAYWLTGNKGIDYSDAAGTAVFDVSAGRWSREVLDVLSLPAGILPEVQSSESTRGLLRKDLAERFGLGEVEVAAGAADNAASALGLGLIAPGEVMVSLGTSGTVVAVAEDASPDASGRLHLFNHAVPGRNYFMGVMLAAASAVDFFTSKMGRAGADWSELSAGVGAVPPGAGGLLYLPYLSGERTPLRDAEARGVLCGLSHRSDWFHILRAALEGVSFGLRDNFELIEEKTEVKRVYLTGGGARNSLWRRILAANLKKPLIVPEVDEGGAYGAAMLAAAGDGRSFEELAAWVRPKLVEEPQERLAAAYDRWYPEYQALYLDLKSRFKRLVALSSKG